MRSKRFSTLQFNLERDEILAGLRVALSLFAPVRLGKLFYAIRLSVAPETPNVSLRPPAVAQCLRHRRLDRCFGLSPSAALAQNSAESVVEVWLALLGRSLPLQVSSKVSNRDERFYLRLERLLGVLGVLGVWHQTETGEGRRAYRRRWCVAGGGRVSYGLQLGEQLLRRQ